MNLLAPVPGEKILDVGCGNGALTAKIAEAGADVLGIDHSAEMLAKAERSFPELNFRQAEADSFDLGMTFDAVFSNAVFHWIKDQEGLLACISRHLRQGGRLVCEFGGTDCARTVHDAAAAVFAGHGLSYRFVFHFRSVGEFAPMVEAHGMRVEYAAWFPRKTAQNGPKGLENWIRMFLADSFEGIAPAEADEMIAEIVERCRPVLYENGTWYVDYTRIRMKAIKL